MNPPSVFDYGGGISAVDSAVDHKRDRAQQTAIHLVVEHGRAAIVDTGTARGAPRALEVLAQQGIAAEQVDYIVLTHVHLDHAGGAGTLAAQCPNARVTVHPRGARHVIDPARLLSATEAIYGAEATRRIYGDVLPVARERVLETPEGARISLAGRELQFLDAPGHARHHVVVRDGATGHLFAGDSFGLSYRELDDGGRQFAFPTTSPSQFDPPALQHTVGRMLALAPGAVYVAHFGQLRDTARLGADLQRLIEAHAALGERCRGASERRFSLLKEGVTSLVLAERARQGWPVSEEKTLEIFALDIELNAQGLDVWLGAEGD